MKVETSTSNSAEISPVGLDGGGVGHQVAADFCFYPVPKFALMRTQMIRRPKDPVRQQGRQEASEAGVELHSTLPTCRRAAYPLGNSLTPIFPCPSVGTLKAEPALTAWLAYLPPTRGHCPLAFSHSLSRRSFTLPCNSSDTIKA